ncbi:MAG: hypothetical protein V1897_07145 [Pseudomonadota bacterium]
MTLDKSAQDMDLSSIPSEFRENYKFLSELIECKEKNNIASMGLESMVEERLRQIRGKLNRRQVRILTNYLKEADALEDGPIAPPVSAELEASIRMRNRVAWLPWEAEAIRKIERWRADVGQIAVLWNNQTGVSAPNAVSKVTWIRSVSKPNVKF